MGGQTTFTDETNQEKESSETLTPTASPTKLNELESESKNEGSENSTPPKYMSGISPHRISFITPFIPRPPITPRPNTPRRPPPANTPFVSTSVSQLYEQIDFLRNIIRNQQTTITTLVDKLDDQQQNYIDMLKQQQDQAQNQQQQLQQLLNNSQVYGQHVQQQFHQQYLRHQQQQQQQQQHHQQQYQQQQQQHHQQHQQAPRQRPAQPIVQPQPPVQPPQPPVQPPHPSVQPPQPPVQPSQLPVQPPQPFVPPSVSLQHPHRQQHQGQPHQVHQPQLQRPQVQQPPPQGQQPPQERMRYTQVQQQPQVRDTQVRNAEMRNPQVQPQRNQRRHMHMATTSKTKTTIITDSTCRLITYRDILNATDSREEQIELSKHNGATSDILHHMTKFYLENDLPDNLILVSGLNDILKQKREKQEVDCKEVADSVINTGKMARDSGVGRVCISEIIKPKYRDDHPYVNEVNDLIRQQCSAENFVFISHGNIGMSDLGDNLHVSRDGNVKLKHNILSQCYTYDRSF